MVGRVRTRSIPRTSGPRINNLTGVPSGAGQVVGSGGSCTDVTGYGDCTPFSTDTYSFEGCIINWPNPNTFGSSFVNYVADFVRNSIVFGPGNVSLPTDVEAAVAAAARSNPSRPVVDVPANILDIGTAPTRILRDITDLFGRRGPSRPPPRPSPRELARGGGEAWLNYQFLIRPIVGDIVKMANISDQIRRRIDEINRLYTTNGIRRTMNIGAGSVQAVNNITLQSAGGLLINKQVTTITTARKSVHIRWAPTTRCGLRPPANVIRAWAVQSVQGMTLDLSTLWEITPWSWLADWFTDIGSYLKATRNIVPARMIGAWPMTETLSVAEIPSFTSGLCHMTPGSVRRSRKVRSPSTPLFPTARLPFLNGGQMGIVAALAATRR